MYGRVQDTHRDAFKEKSDEQIIKEIFSVLESVAS